MIPPRSDVSPKMEEVLASISAAETMKRRKDLPAREADTAGRKDEVQEAIRTAFARHGRALTDEEVERGTAAYFARRLLFIEPKLGFSTVVAKAWIHRFQLLRKAALVGTALVAIALAIQFLVLQPIAARREAEFRAAQLAWAHASGEFDAAQGQIELMLKGVAADLAKAESMPGSATAAATETASAALKDLVHQVQVTTESAKAARYALEPTAMGAAISSKEEAALKTRALHEAEGQLDHLSRKIEALATRHRELQVQGKALETAWAAFVAAQPPAALRSKIGVDHDLAERALRALEAPGEVARVRLEIEDATKQIKALADLPEQIRAAAKWARSKSAQAELPPTLAAEEMKALAAVAAGDLGAARREMALLEEAAVRLQQVFTMKIVNQPNEYTRIWTYKKNNHALKSYYIIVEAIGPDGQPLPMSIRSEEDGSVATVTRWAERVDEETYEAVGRDKKDDGIVQRNTFAEKRAGFLEPDYRMGPKARGADKNGGRIYRWPRRTS